jgi:hypothetical protein
MDLPYRSDLPSPIHGVGVFATRLIRQGELVPGAHQIGFHGFNHSCDPNLGPRAEDEVSLRPALRDIQPGEELDMWCVVRYKLTPRRMSHNLTSRHT